jgi:hypothetical protein
MRSALGTWSGSRRPTGQLLDYLGRSKTSPPACKDCGILSVGSSVRFPESVIVPVQQPKCVPLAHRHELRGPTLLGHRGRPERRCRRWRSCSTAAVANWQRKASRVQPFPRIDYWGGLPCIARSPMGSDGVIRDVPRLVRRPPASGAHDGYHGVAFCLRHQQRLAHRPCFAARADLHQNLARAGRASPGTVPRSGLGR